MYPRSVLLALLAALTPGCKNVDCGDGTTERNGLCVASTETVSAARCGTLTELHGDTCVPKFPPTTCDPMTTAGGAAAASLEHRLFGNLCGLPGNPSTSHHRGRSNDSANPARWHD